MKMLYFAWLREKAGIASEELDAPADVATVADLIRWQRGRGERFAEAFADDSLIRVAVNQQHVPLDHPVKPEDEVAFFPPVTGG